MTQSEEDRYYTLIDSSGPQVVVLGEPDEQWTDEVLRVLEGAGLKASLLRWPLLEELRLQLEAVHYPLTQLWRDGSLKAEVSGYHNEMLKDLIDKAK